MKIIKPKKVTEGKWKWIVHDCSMASLHGDNKSENHVLSCSPCKNCQKEGESPFNRCTMPCGGDIKVLRASKETMNALVRMVEEFGEEYQFDSSPKGHALGEALEALEYAGCEIDFEEKTEKQ